MCGIVGVVAKPGRLPKVSDSTLRAMSDAIAHRGPDGQGTFRRAEVAFAHRRLAIRDPQHGRQPWNSRDGQCVLTYNGEVYNDRELRSELETHGHRFSTRCDTEVVMAAYRQWGTDCVNRLHGMFAFGLYDFERQQLLLVRDRFGVKPLVWCDVDDCVAFASEPVALLAWSEVSRQPDWAVISQHLSTFRSTLGDRTVYANIRQLPPAHYLLSIGDKIRIVRYWSHPEHESASDISSFESHFDQAVTRRLVSDVPVGLFLSGGVDSSTIGTKAHDYLDIGTPSFCVTGEQQTSEMTDSHFAKRCATHLRTDHTTITLDAETYWSRWQEMIHRLQVPLSTPNDVLIYEMAKTAKRSVSVVLGGEGADELLGGYAAVQWSGHDYDRSRQLAENRFGGSSAARRLAEVSLQRTYGRTRFESATDHFLSSNCLIPTAVKPHLVAPEFWEDAEYDSRLTTEYQTTLDEQPDQATSNRYARLLHRINLEGLLGRLDQTTMLAGLETRVPFTDHEFVEYASRLPVEHKLRLSSAETAPFLSAPELAARGAFESKVALREFARHRLPIELADRPKASFPTPVAYWIANDWRERIQLHLATSRFIRSVFNPAAISELRENPAAAGMWLWPILNLSFWGDAVLF
ncbi:asparagine synthase (glutamine-hydrolyzing) [Thalassoroseus pseudoceratinae]|uniref:asparagine synthase (glutamine-hydrolyzing) n=1 Tax=Thalassoroseus pseudoceratinae TaxID=2713176 RepID=UPI0014229C8E|nr:asparagine synthase (glutamine-hydrolyzing) [Thalassoroseus pseudoceratinae]